MPKQKLLITEAKIFDNNTMCITCPQCKGMILCDKNKINCKQFKHGIPKPTNENPNPKQLNPHRNTNNSGPDKIYGCGAYFKVKII